MMYDIIEYCIARCLLRNMNTLEGLPSLIQQGGLIGRL